VTAEPTLRERKKALTRQAILDAAQRLFAERGFDEVTVAEIADNANVSVKTLFVYFRSKEDLVFSDYDLLDSLVAALASRPDTTPPATAVANALIDRVRRRSDGVAAMFDWQPAYGNSSALQTGLLRQWSVYEDRITEELARESGRPATPNTRLHAIQLVGLLRCATSGEMRAELDPDDPQAINKLARWLRKAARDVGSWSGR